MHRPTVIRLVLPVLIFISPGFEPVLAERSQPLVGNGHRQRGPVIGGGPIYQAPKRSRIRPRSQLPKRVSPVRKRRAKPIRRRQIKVLRRPLRRRFQRQRSPYRKTAQRRRKRLWRRSQPPQKSHVRRRLKRRYWQTSPKKVYAKRQRRKIRSKPAIPKKNKRFITPAPITRIFTKLAKPMEQSMVFPLLLPYPITRAFGWSLQPGSRGRTFHQGVDIAAPVDLPVVAAYSGTVLRAGPEVGYGLSVLLSHRRGEFLTRYGSCSKLFTQADRLVNQGQIICEVDNSDGQPHLHFEMLVRQANGKYIAQDPEYRTNVALVRLTQRLHLARTRSR